MAFALYSELAPVLGELLKEVSWIVLILILRLLTLYFLFQAETNKDRINQANVKAEKLINN